MTRTLGVAAVALFLALAFTPLPNALHWRFVDKPPRLEPAQAIVVLGAGANDRFLHGNSLRRAVHGIRLYQLGLAPTLVLLGPPEGASAMEAAVRAELARDLGVQAEALVLAGGHTTREEAQRCWERLGARGATRILLVTGSHHMWRARVLFARAGFEVLPAPIDESAPAAAQPEARLGLARSLLQEGMARLAYRLAGRV